MQVDLSKLVTDLDLTLLLESLTNGALDHDHLVTALILSIERGNEQASELLIQKADIIDSLKIASEQGNVCVVKYLLKYYGENGENTESSETDYEIYKPIYWAIKHDQLKIAKLFIEDNPLRVDYPCHIEVNNNITTSYYPLWVASKYGSIQCINYLLKMGADINKYSGYSYRRFLSFQRTALCIAAEMKQDHAARVLLLHGASTTNVVQFTNRRYIVSQVESFIEFQQQLTKNALEKQYQQRLLMVDCTKRTRHDFVDISICTRNTEITYK